MKNDSYIFFFLRFDLILLTKLPLFILFFGKKRIKYGHIFIIKYLNYKDNFIKFLGREKN